MAEALKNIYNVDFIDQLSMVVQKSYPNFNRDNFTKSVFSADWQGKELKDRMRHIAVSLHKFLPKDYATSIEILKPASKNFGGFEAMFFPDYVELYGMEDYDVSIEALEHFTRYSSSEFAVRPFIVRYEDKMMAQMNDWTQSDNEHVRRLATEGCRPRLPWAMSLPKFKKDPTAILSILETLKQDDSEYVRRSVANNLNDISKDNPDILIKTAQNWLGHNADTDRLVKHACRTLLKAGDVNVLKMFGFSSPAHIEVKDFEIQSEVNMGDRLGFSFSLNGQQQNLGRIRIEYAIDFMKNNGKQSRKIFKISESDYKNQNKHIVKNYSFKKISTRKYYAGIHGIAIIVNGQELASGDFLLK